MTQLMYIASDVKKLHSNCMWAQKKTPRKTNKSFSGCCVIQITKKKSLTREIEHKQYLLFSWDITGRLNARMESPLHNRKSFLHKIQFTFHQLTFLIYSGHSRKESSIVSNSIYSR